MPNYEVKTYEGLKAGHTTSYAHVINAPDGAIAYVHTRELAEQIADALNVVAAPASAITEALLVMIARVAFAMGEVAGNDDYFAGVAPSAIPAGAQKLAMALMALERRDSRASHFFERYSDEVITTAARAFMGGLGVSRGGRFDGDLAAAVEAAEGLVA